MRLKIWAMMILPLADTLQNCLQNLTSRIAGIDNEQMTNRVLGTGAMLGFGLGAIKEQFKTPDIPSKSSNKISENVYENLKLYKDDVLICRTNGNPKLVGKSAIVPMNYEFAYASYLFKVRPKIDLINSSTLVTYLNSKYGRMEIEKHSMVGNQANFSPAKFREINIPIFDKKFNLKIEENTYLAFNLLIKSQELY